MSFPSWKGAMESSWLKWVGGAVIGMVATAITSLSPDLFWLHDTRYSLSMLVANQPLIQRDIADLKTNMSELNVTIKELTVELQKKRADDAATKRKH